MCSRAAVRQREGERRWDLQGPARAWLPGRAGVIVS
jgi:hypothetical protein